MLLLIPPALVQGPPQGPPPMGPRHAMEVPLLRCARELGLRDDQMIRIHAVMATHRDSVEQKELALHQAHRALHEALRMSGSENADMESLARTAAAKELDLVREVSLLNRACWDILDANQREKAKALLSRPPMEGPGGPGGMGHAPGHGFGGPGRGGPGFGAPRQGGPESGGQGLPPGPPPGGPEEDGF